MPPLIFVPFNLSRLSLGVQQAFRGLGTAPYSGRAGQAIRDCRATARKGGEKVLEQFHYGSATKQQPFKRGRPEHGVRTEKYEKELEHWEKLLKQIGHK
jgi:hypothetical protein